MAEGSALVEMTVAIVSAYVGANEVPPQDLPDLIGAVHTALRDLELGSPIAESALQPAVAVKRSVTPDHIICLEDGKKFKSLKRHLRTRYGMSPEEYKAKWGLPSDYPMVAPNYAKARSALAKRMGLGTARRGD
jgi:predicted transcriptional regulator